MLQQYATGSIKWRIMLHQGTIDRLWKGQDTVDRLWKQKATIDRSWKECNAATRYY